MEELEVAKAKIVDLEKRLEEVKAGGATPKQEDKAEDKLDKALARLEALEQKYQPAKPDPEIKEEEEDEDGDQCPVCGTVLNDMSNGEYYCPGCKEYFEEE